jgi:hypothetical protein
VRVDAGGTEYHLPVAVFDNREDKTSFLRADPPTWPVESVALLHAELQEAFHALLST